MEDHSNNNQTPKLIRHAKWLQVKQFMPQTLNNVYPLLIY